MLEFTQVYENEEFIDYETHIPDRNEVGMKIRITLRKQIGDRLPIGDTEDIIDAFMVIVCDDMDGSVYDNLAFDVSIKWAKRMVGYKEETV